VSFAAAWLTLREPADAAARDPGLLAEAAALLGDSVGLDLGCGTGATVRAFGGRGRWRLVDRDPGLLALAAERCPAAAVVEADLADLGRLPLAGVALVTASALLDLVSEAWIEELAGRLAGAAVGLYAVLSFDGSVAWRPPLPEDAAVVAAFNRHQRRDKGLGPALGPAAAPALARAFERRGYAVRMAASPWRLGPAQAPLQAAFVEGVAAAAAETGLASGGWRQARLAASATSACTVGHVDLLALPRAQSKMTSESRP
jgi:SAM-dependent methyltransferase